jgi:hypothetical protein
MIAAALVILWLAAAYLVALGLVAIVRPTIAQRFLGGFAQTGVANWAEAIIRFMIGLAMVVAAPVLPFQPFFMIAGGFLMLTALAMPLLADRHRDLAARSVAAVAPFMRLIGLVSLVGGAVLGFILSAVLE